MKTLETEVLTQIDLAHGFVFNDVRRMPRGQHGAFADDIGAVCNAQRFTDVVVGNQHANAALLEEADNFLDLEHGNWVNAGERFVEQNKSRLRSQCACNLDSATFAP